MVPTGDETRRRKTTGHGPGLTAGIQLQWNRLKSLKPSLAEIQKVERDNAKKRFTLKPAAGADETATDPRDWLIRANQGHSIEVASEALHTPLTLDDANVPAIVVHGTYFAFWPAIVAAGGLKRMGRTHVHFGTGLPGGDNGKAPVHSAQDEEQATEEADAPEEQQQQQQQPKVISGMRADAEVLIFVDVEASLRNGDMTWWLSSNGVVLTAGDADGVVPLKYFREVRGRRQGVGLLWKDGQHVADLPDGLHVRVPQGKDRQGGRGAGGRGGGRGGGGRGGRGGRGRD